MSRRARIVIALLAVGAVLRAAALPLPDSGDMGVFRLWTFHAVQGGSAAALYGIDSEWPPQRQFVSYQDIAVAVDYPPVALYYLGGIGRLYRAVTGSLLPESRGLGALIKSLALAFQVVVCGVIFWLVRRLLDTPRAAVAVTAFWTNPATILNVAVVGLLDPLFVAPLIGAFGAAVLGSPLVAGVLAATAVLTKPQALMLMPLIGLAVLQSGDRRLLGRRVLLAGVGAAAAAALLVSPVAVAGGFWRMTGMMAGTINGDNWTDAANIWHCVAWAGRAYFELQTGSLWSALTLTMEPLPFSTMYQYGLRPRLIGTEMTALAFAWAVHTARRVRDPWRLAGFGAFCMHAYFTLAMQAHVNHLYAAVPLLAIAAAGRPGFRPAFLAISAIQALNLYLFFGLDGQGGGVVPPGITVVDATVVLAAANCLALVWHARLFRRECAADVAGVPPSAAALVP
jgi:hypothetical protein